VTKDYIGIDDNVLYIPPQKLARPTSRQCEVSISYLAISTRIVQKELGGCSNKLGKVQPLPL